MSVSLTYYTSDSHAIKALQKLEKCKYLGFDTETTGLCPESIDERLRLVQFSDGKRAYIFDIWRLKKAKAHIKRILESDEIVKIAHNAKFDIKFARADLDVKRFGTVFCTMLAAQIIAQAKYDCNAIFNQRFALNDVLASVDIFVDKSEQLSDWSRLKLTLSQLEYAASDVLHLIKLREKLLAELKALRVIKTAKLEFDALEPVGTMELNGIMLDEDKWLRQYELTKREHEEVHDRIQELLAPNEPTLFPGVRRFNLNSTQQLSGRLLDLGIDLSTVEETVGGNIDETTNLVPFDTKTSTNSNLLKQIEDVHEVIPLIVRYRVLQTRLSRYGLNIIDAINPTTGRLHANYKNIGAKTSRMSCHKPALQQIPKKNEYRNGFRARPGYKLVWGDYSQIELRILAEYCGDVKFREAFLKGFDFHRFSASLIFEKPYDKVTDAERNIAKNLNFGIVYGIGKRRYAQSVGITEEHAERIIESYYNNYPGLRVWLNSAARQARYGGYSMTGIGRVIRYDFDKSNQKWASLIERNGKNTPIQGTSCDILKRALRLLHNEIAERDDIFLVHVVHDEIVLEVKADCVKIAEKILRSTMLEAAHEFIKEVPVKVDVKKGVFWKK